MEWNLKVVLSKTKPEAYAPQKSVSHVLICIFKHKCAAEQLLKEQLDFQGLKEPRNAYLNYK